MRKIGIIGGMGPEATALLFQRIVAQTPADDDRDHLPLLIDNDPGIPSRIAFLIEGNKIDPTAHLCKIAQNLEKAGCSALAMPCNTAHFFAKAISESVSIPLINMIEHTARHIKTKGWTKIGMFCSPALRKVGVFEAAFAQNGLEALFPANDSEPLQIIRQIKAGQPPDTALIARLLSELEAHGAHGVLISCSELSLFRDHLVTPLPLVDSLDVLTTEILCFAKGSSQKTH